MKRLLFLTAIIIMVFSFSSCEVADWFLGMVYPSGNKTIIVDLGIDGGNQVSQHDVVIAIVPVFKDLTTNQLNPDTTKIVSEKFRNQQQIHWEFSGLGNNSYIVIAFFDTDDNGTIGSQEPSVSFPVDNMMGETVFDFTRDTSPDQLSGNAFLGMGPGVDPKILEKLIGGDNFVNASFNIEGPETINSTSLGWMTYNIIANDPTIPVQSFTWKLLDANRADITCNGPSTDWYSFIDIDFGNTYPSLWSMDTDVILSVEATFDNNLKWVQEKRIHFTTSSGGGSAYDLYVNFNTTEAYGYVDVYIYDSYSWNTLAYNYRYLDSYGYGNVNFYGIVDPPGMDQILYINFYDSSWNMTGYAQIPLTGEPYSTNTITITDFDVYWY